MGFIEGAATGAATGMAGGPWGAIAGAVIGGIGGMLGKKQAKYTPNPEWMAMRSDVMSGIRKGLEEGGYTWSDEMGDSLYRGAMENIAQTYGQAGRRTVEAMAPYGNVGSMRRSLSSINIARAGEEAKAGRELDIARESTKLQSYSNLLNLGAGMQDPNLPQLQASLANVGQPRSNLMSGLETGLATYMNLTGAQASEERWNKLFDRMVPPSGASPVNVPSSSNLMNWGYYSPKTTSVGT